MRMRELEKASGVGRETIRYYIREGLLPEPDRASRNSAFYSEDHVTRLKAIKRLQEERFLPLAVIRSLLEAEDGSRWLAPGAFPMLDTMVAARFGSDAQRLPLDKLIAEQGLDPAMVADHAAIGMVEIDADGMVTPRDAAILKTMQELADIGFTDELGFKGDQIKFYVDFIDWVTTQELRLFFEHTVGHVGEARAIDMAESGISIVNELLSQLRTRSLLKKLAERRRVANDNS
jgi:DNA-binding transcriptional MerR regulator